MGLLVLILIVGVGVAAAVSYSRYQGRQRRMRSVADLAHRIGFTFTPADQSRMVDMPFSFFKVGSGRKVELVIAGMHNDLPLCIFDYQYYIDSGRSRTYHYFTCALLTIPAGCPPLRLTHENVLTRLGDHISHQDVKLEYDDFNRRFHVDCKEQKFAFALLDGQMMEWLLSADTFDRVEIIGPWVLLTRSRLDPAAWLNLGVWLDTFHAHIPAIVYSTFPRG
jgi:Protein of unknown function (DUF3137)